MAVNGVSDTVVTNRKARHEYHIEMVYTAGMMLTGTEVKSLRDGKANIQEAYCALLDNEVWVLGMNINTYKDGTYNNHDPLRRRKLLLTQPELRKIRKALDKQGMTLVPLKIFFNERNLAKMDIGVGQGKKLYDKREDSKEKDVQRDLKRRYG